MNSDSITTKRKLATQSMEQANTQFACHFQIIYYELIHGRHQTPLQIMMANFIYQETYGKHIINDLITVGVKN